MSVAAPDADSSAPTESRQREYGGNCKASTHWSCSCTLRGIALQRKLQLVMIVRLSQRSAGSLAVRQVRYSPNDAPKRNEVMKMLDNMSSRLVVVGEKSGRAGGDVEGERLKCMGVFRKSPWLHYCSLEWTDAGNTHCHFLNLARSLSFAR